VGANSPKELCGLQTQGEYRVLLMKIHSTTIDLLIRMYDPEEFQAVMETLALALLTEEQEGHAFMVLDFDDDYIADPQILGPTENYRLN
jgi:hypothetical protein